MKVVYKKSENKADENGKRFNTIILCSVALLVILSAVFVFILHSFSFIPSKYKGIVYVAVAVVDAFLALIALMPKTGRKAKIGSACVCLLFSVVLLFVDILMPIYKGRLEKAFPDIPEKGTLTINVYVLNDSEITDISQMAGRSIGLQQEADQEYQTYALNMVNRECGSKPVSSISYPNVSDLVGALLDGEVDAILLNETYVELLADSLLFDGINEKIRSIYSCEQYIDNEYNNVGVDSITTEPFIVLLGGNDTYSYNLIKNTTSAGRTAPVAMSDRRIAITWSGKWIKRQ